VSVGGITEHIARVAKHALREHLTAGDEGASDVTFCGELLKIFGKVKAKDSDPEGRRLVTPLLNTLSYLLAEGCVAQDIAAKFCDCVIAVVRSSQDMARLRASISVFTGLMRWPGNARALQYTCCFSSLGTVSPQYGRQLPRRFISDSWKKMEIS